MSASSGGYPSFFFLHLWRYCLNYPKIRRMPFIKAIYKHRDSDEEMILATRDKAGLTLLSGEYAFSAFKVLSLGSREDYEGQFIVSGYDILEDIGNHHPPIIRLDASLPFLEDECFPSNQIDMYVEHFAEESHLSESEFPYFRHLFWGIYEALRERPLYVLVNLSSVDEAYAKAVFDLLGKIMKGYPIIVYAPSLKKSSKPKSLLFLDGYDEASEEEEERKEGELSIKEGKKDSSDDYEAMDAFFGELEEKLNEPEEGEKPKEKDPEALQAKEEKKKRFYNPLFSMIFSGFALVTGVIYMGMETSTLFMVAHILLLIAFLVMSFAALESSRKSLSFEEFYKLDGNVAKSLMLSAIIDILGIFISITFMAIKGFKFFHVIFLIIYLLAGAASVTYFFLFRHLTKQKMEKEAWRTPSK